MLFKKKKEQREMKRFDERVFIILSVKPLRKKRKQTLKSDVVWPDHSVAFLKAAGAQE